MKIALGPVTYYWPREVLLGFYERVMDWPVDIVYLGETVCSKRRPLRTPEWLELAERLAAAGKEVVLSTLSLIEAESELNTLRRTCANGRYAIEANDMSAVQLVAGKAPFITGPTVNVYNGAALKLFAGLGLQRWVMPVELSRTTLADLQRQRPAGVETELFAFGRLPLSISARCFTAHHHKLPKDDCQFRCLQDPDGIPLATQEDEPFLTINGVQLQSAAIYSLLGELDDIRALNVDVLRISPISQRTDQVVRIFRDAVSGRMSPAEGQARLGELIADGLCDGYWHGKAGIELSRARPGLGQ